MSTEQTVEQESTLPERFNQSPFYCPLCGKRAFIGGTDKGMKYIYCRPCAQEFLIEPIWTYAAKVAGGSQEYNHEDGLGYDDATDDERIEELETIHRWWHTECKNLNHTDEDQLEAKREEIIETYNQLWKNYVKKYFSHQNSPYNE